MLMVRLKINSSELEVQEGLTILDVARNAGFSIPTLCHNDGLPHYTSCMVCMVKDKRANNFIPSCSVVVQEGMDLDISGEEVIALRRKAVELLLSEHRAECEAPCRVVCPAGYNIPLMNRYIAARDYDNAVKLTLSELISSEIACTICQGYCENACRRKKIDIPVSIRNIKIFIYQTIKKESLPQDTGLRQSENESGNTGRRKNLKLSGRFNSLIGRIDTTEQAEWLKECTGNVLRNREIVVLDQAAGEAESCMHCDCRASKDCRLRDIAEKLSLKDPRGKLVNSPIVKKINYNTGLVFENAKCIKCGLCVRLCEDSKDEPALCFINRGFVSIISEPLTEEFDNILITKSKEVIAICPTGALSQFK
jgi:predicted molibdopterin-dependent oxidoreductase YjgC